MNWFIRDKLDPNGKHQQKTVKEEEGLRKLPIVTKWSHLSKLVRHALLVQKLSQVVLLPYFFFIVCYHFYTKKQIKSQTEPHSMDKSSAYMDSADQDNKQRILPVMLLLWEPDWNMAQVWIRAQYTI